jgi:hypothetical protein
VTPLAMLSSLAELRAAVRMAERQCTSAEPRSRNSRFV